ncbi:hypothetical protein [Roseisolibacter sp. H3M3-2]|uniref:hypothetical protein n=1 Tax=Roseisolibacter sp. H3M3-2 TaxID=3031323 RepID=UPI0023DCC191|nr:hypothetical protein [Roseisolibacter sp. H3M3-2]MDF1505019.1 hypothetical protein [Roseisolibacter sp. H3M3-2]
MRRPLLTLATALTGACAAARVRPAATGAPRCALPAPVLVHRAGDTLVSRHDFRAAPPDAWDDRALTALRDVRTRLRAALDVDTRALLARQAAYWAAHPDPALRREAENGTAVRSGRVGTVRDAGCLEALLVDAQARRTDMVDRPTEFQALVLRRGDARRVYLAGSTAPWPPKLPPRVDALLAADRRDGWHAESHGHNHPFYLAKRDTGDVAGAVAPSLSDVQLWRALRTRLGLRGAWVTNGFATAHFTAADFDALSTHP